MASDKAIYTEMMWDGCTWLVSGKNECKREAARIKVLHPHDEIKEIEY